MAEELPVSDSLRSLTVSHDREVLLARIESLEAEVSALISERSGREAASQDLPVQTALRASEARYRMLFRSIDEGFCVIQLIFDDDGRAVDYRFMEGNPAWEEHTGLRGALGRTARELLPDLEEHWFEIYGRVARTREPVRFESGSEVMGRWFDVYAFPVEAPEERKVALLFTNVTERVRTREELERANAELVRLTQAAESAREAAERANRTKSQFLAVISHELRTPLTGIIGYADLLETEVLGSLSERQREAIERMKGSAWHLVSIIEEILTLSRVEAGKEIVRGEQTRVEEIARAVASIVEPQAESAGLKLSIETPAEPLVTWTDPGKLRQILTNLVGNAVKYTPAGEVRISLGSSAPGWLEVRVSDTGPGIDPADHERVFEAFTRVDASYTRSGSGTGLGLAICRRLARLLGGDITLRSTPGEGSTFTLALPLRGDPEA